MAARLCHQFDPQGGSDLERAAPLTLAVLIPTPELHLIIVGFIPRGPLVFGSHCQRGQRLRIISARKATARERKQYEEGIGKETG